MRHVSPVVLSLVLLVSITISFLSCNQSNGKARVLVFGKTAGYHHESIADGYTAIAKLGSQNNFDVDTTTDASLFNEDSLQKYAAVVFFEYHRRCAG